MTHNFIPVNKPLITKSDIESVINCLKEGWISGDGPVIENFEKSFANFCGRKYAVAVSNGTVAIDLALEALRIKSGDEVIVPSFTIISCISYLLRIGAVPIFVDADPQTWNLDVNQLEEKITSRTKAIIVPHIYGLPAEIDRVIDLANLHRIPLIEDAAESHGLKFKGLQCGSFGEVSTLSFYANKNITAGEGGMILTDNIEIYEIVKNLRNLNFRTSERFINDELGYNYRMSSMQAALGLSQLNRIEEIIARRRSIGKFYTSEFKDLENLQLPLEKTDYAENTYWVYGLKLTGLRKGKSKEFQQSLEKNGIGTRPFFQSLHKQPVLKKFGLEKQPSLPVTEDLSSSGFYIPNGLGMSDTEIEFVANKVKKVLNE